MSETRAMTVRLNPDLAEDVEFLAKVEGTSVNEQVQQALADRVAERRADPEFAARLQKAIARNQRALERLAQ